MINSTAEKTGVSDLSRLSSFQFRDLVGSPLSRPLSLEIWQCLRLSLSAAQPVMECKAAECAEGFRPPHSWCYSDSYHDMPHDAVDLLQVCMGNIHKG